jgi:hypothetical protein
MTTVFVSPLHLPLAHHRITILICFLLNVLAFVSYATNDFALLKFESKSSLNYMSSIG